VPQVAATAGRGGRGVVQIHQYLKRDTHEKRRRSGCGPPGAPSHIRQVLRAARVGRGVTCVSPRWLFND
jgi:hypothetical protein